MLRALRETDIEGVATTIPADVAILEHPDFAAVEHSTKWVEERLDLSGIGASPPAAAEAHSPGTVQRDVEVEVNGRRYQVRLWVPDTPAGAPAPPSGATPAGPARGASRPRAAASSHHEAGAGAGSVVVPMQGTIVKVLVSVGDAVEVGQAVCVLEAMKMENHINTETAGTVQEVRVSPGDTVGAGDVVAVID
jgi:acetyl-CoA/propionyl-CoA carboxylase biotin carboxyl carrier protein